MNNYSTLLSYPVESGLFNELSTVHILNNYWPAVDKMLCTDILGAKKDGVNKKGPYNITSITAMSMSISSVVKSAVGELIKFSLIDLKAP